MSCFVASVVYKLVRILRHPNTNSLKEGRGETEKR